MEQGRASKKRAQEKAALEYRHGEVGVKGSEPWLGDVKDDGRQQRHDHAPSHSQKNPRQKKRKRGRDPAQKEKTDSQPCHGASQDLWLVEMVKGFAGPDPDPDFGECGEGEEPAHVGNAELLTKGLDKEKNGRKGGPHHQRGKKKEQNARIAEAFPKASQQSPAGAGISLFRNGGL